MGDFFVSCCMRSYYRIMLGRGSKYANECHEKAFIGCDFDFNTDLSGKLPENWRDFNKEFIPYYLEKQPGKSKITAGLACGATHTICKGISIGDLVICPDGKGNYLVGEVLDEYKYVPSSSLPHQRSVKWYPKSIPRTSMTQELRYSAGSIGTVSNITKYAEEIELLISDSKPPVLISTDDSVEDPTVFALEKHLEDFLVANWSQTNLGKSYDIFEEEGELVGQQYPTDTGPIDILAISKDKKTILVIELKKGRASDTVVGQIQRYMGFVNEELLEDGQTVKGIIIALEDDLRLKRALSMTNNIDFYRYEIEFKLIK